MLSEILRGGPGCPRVGDPGHLVEAALHHGVGAHLLAAVERRELSLPQKEREALGLARARQALHGRLLRLELVTVAPVLDEACGTPPLLIKGAAVAQLRPDPRWRPFVDLDLVVPRAALGAATVALERLGYERGPEPWPGYGECHGHEVALSRRVGRRRLLAELHWRISDDRAADALDHGRLASGAVPLDPGDRSVLVPAGPAHLLVLALHLLHEPAKRLLWIEDIALMARALSEPEWRAAFDLAEELGLGWVLHRGLDYAARYLGLARTRPSAPPRLPRWGPLRAGERLEGWIAFQAGRVPVAGWQRSDGYLRSAVRARLGSLW